jgi:2-haloacid dehalogenase
VLALSAAAPFGAHAGGPQIRAVAFDAFVMFDIRTISAKAREVLGERGDSVRAVWLQKIFAYTWLRTTARQYAPFAEVVAEALAFAATANGVTLQPSERAQLCDAFNALPAWPDVRGRLDQLRAQGLKTALLSNMSEAALRSNLRHNDLEALVDHVLSTDRVRAFKPAPEAYAMGPKAFGLAKTEIAFAAYGAWDASGAQWFGYPTVWIDRTGQVAETVTPPIAHVGQDLTALAGLIARGPT